MKYKPSIFLDAMSIVHPNGYDGIQYACCGAIRQLTHTVPVVDGQKLETCPELELLITYFKGNKNDNDLWWDCTDWSSRIIALQLLALLAEQHNKE